MYYEYTNRKTNDSIYFILPINICHIKSKTVFFKFIIAIKTYLGLFWCIDFFIVHRIIRSIQLNEKNRFI